MVAVRTDYADHNCRVGAWIAVVLERLSRCARLCGRVSGVHCADERRRRSSACGKGRSAAALVARPYGILSRSTASAEAIAIIPVE